jgi:hypothetical protein
MSGTVWQQKLQTASTVAIHGVRWPRKEILRNFPQRTKNPEVTSFLFDATFNLCIFKLTITDIH